MAFFETNIHYRKHQHRWNTFEAFPNSLLSLFDSTASAPLISRDGESTILPKPIDRGDSHERPHPTLMLPTNNNKALNFPHKLAMAIRYAPDAIAEWSHDGTAFGIHSSAQFESQILPLFFPSTKKFASLVRKLNRWGFRRPHELVLPFSRLDTVYRHDCFHRDHPERISEMKYNVDQLPTSGRPMLPRVASLPRILPTVASLPPMLPPIRQPVADSMAESLLQHHVLQLPPVMPPQSLLLPTSTLLPGSFPSRLPNVPLLSSLSAPLPSPLPSLLPSTVPSLIQPMASSSIHSNAEIQELPSNAELLAQLEVLQRRKDILERCFGMRR